MLHELLRITRLFWGLFLYALGIVLTINANIGVSPWDVFHQGLSRHIGLTMGMTSIITSFALISIALLMKERIGFGTLCNMLLIGAFLDVLLINGWVPVMSTFTQGVIMILFGLLVISFASYFYIGAGYGSGPRDSLMVIFAKRSGKSVGFCRGCIEGSVFLAGWLLGGHVGWGTAITVVMVGVIIQLVFTLLRFDVKKVKQESLSETFLRLKAHFKGA